MEIEVIKRDGRTVRFHKEKIQNVIEKGFANVGTHCSEENVRKVLNRALNQIEAADLPQIEIEKIQDKKPEYAREIQQILGNHPVIDTFTDGGKEN